MEFLKERGFNDNDIKDIIDNNYPNVIENIKCVRNCRLFIRYWNRKRNN